MGNPTEQFIDIGIRLHSWVWAGERGKRPFLLLHGLASNALTWHAVAAALNAAGHPVVAVDQRGHGLSEKPDTGYDFATITADLRRLIDTLGWEKPVLAGQSWGGNVLLAFGARYPGVAEKLIFVDGGFLKLAARGSWEQVSTDLRPPALAGMPRATLKARIAAANPEWDDAGLEATLGNFETLADGTIRPWLTLDRHMTILRALYDQKPIDLYPQVTEPVLICAADDGGAGTARKKVAVDTAVAQIPQANAQWFQETAHDIHVHRPHTLADLMLGFANGT